VRWSGRPCGAPDTIDGHLEGHASRGMRLRVEQAVDMARIVRTVMS
jgi:hypothetical protein